MFSPRGLAGLVVILLLLVIALGTAGTTLLVNAVDKAGLSVFHDLVAEGGAGITAFIGVALYEVLVAPWRT